MGTAPTGNQDLIDIIRTHLLCEFMKHGQDNERRDRRNKSKQRPEYCDPWWWPLDPAAELEHWGLLPGDKAVDAKLTSLRPKKPPRKTSYPGFLGSLGARAGCVFIIGERPSFNESYGLYMRDLIPRLELLRTLPDLKDSEFHVTDVIKFRGGSTSPKDKVSDEMIAISRRCLAAEFELLKPKMVLLTCMAGEDVLQVLLRPQLQRYLAHTIVVPHWSRFSFDKDEWVTRVTDAVRTT